uniref:HDC17443 n=1 Tax=Drosophila melanogaster TaxID=7227 RepID=Q6IIP4_DROME|nr:TPA_inf: HDC17443 [Drosophila melanogaster]
MLPAFRMVGWWGWLAGWLVGWCSPKNPTKPLRPTLSTPTPFSPLFWSNESRCRRAAEDVKYSTRKIKDIIRVNFNAEQRAVVALIFSQCTPAWSPSNCNIRNSDSDIDIKPLTSISPASPFCLFLFHPVPRPL